MTDPSETSSASPTPLPLNRTQRRVLGVLIEKAFCTPEYYPMTINAIVTGCNQKSNRDPVVSLSSVDAEDALEALQKLGITTRVYPATGRTERWRHNIKDCWSLDRPHRAILGELLLRGTQTEGDLRSRASRMVEIDSLDELRKYLEELATAGFVRRLSPEEQKRGVLWTHLVMSPRELERVEQEAQQMQVAEEETGSAAPPARKMSAAAPVDTHKSQELEQKIQELQEQLGSLQANMDKVLERQSQLEHELQQLRADLGS